MTTTELDFKTIDEVSDHIKGLYDRGVVAIAVYAFNTTGKTRLAGTFSDYIEDTEIELEQINSLIYGAHFEDAFSWDNDLHEMHFGIESSRILQLIRDEGLENQIIDRFKRYSFSHVEPSFDFEQNLVTFRIATGDDDSQEYVKASRGEESLLIWSIFFTTIVHAIDMLDEDEDNRTDTTFDELKYVVVDDPVSSIDDTKIVSIAIDVAELVTKLASKKIKVLILTHHALFYNVIANSLPNKPSKYGLYQLSKIDVGLRIKTSGDSPFSYHLFAKNLIKTAIENGNIERYHFNLFRALLEKTASFLGYNRWSDCIRETARGDFERLLHLYSHGKLSELESRELSSDEKNLFVDTFNQFIADYKWK